MPTFTPPTAERWTFAQGAHLAPSERRFWGHFGEQPRGQTVLKISGTYNTYSNPTVDQIASATEVYLGGHIYEVDEDTATALENAGYSIS